MHPLICFDKGVGDTTRASHTLVEKSAVASMPCGLIICKFVARTGCTHCCEVCKSLGAGAKGKHALCTRALHRNTLPFDANADLTYCVTPTRGVIRCRLMRGPDRVPVVDDLLDV